MTSTRKGARPGLLVAATALVAVVLMPGPQAGAHGEDGVMTVTAIEQVGPDQIRLEVGIVYANDDDPAEDATVTATLTGPAGEVVGPIDLPRTTGALYGAQAQVPVVGNWTIAVASTTPAAEATGALELIGESSPASPPGPPSTDVLTADAVAVSTDESEEGVLWLWVVVGLALVLLAASAVVVAKRKGA